MGDVYKILESLLQERGISGSKMSADLGMSRSFMTELRKGRAKSITADTAKKIATYFGVSVEYLLGEEAEKAPTPEGEREISDDDLKFALWGDVTDITDDDLDDVRRYAAFIKERKKRGHE